MWDFFTTVRHRHSIRKYQKDVSVEPEKLHAILEMACAAPSAGDLQAYKIFVISNEEKKNQLAEASYEQEFVKDAPISLVFCADPQRSEQKYADRGRQLYALQDATIAASYAQLAIVAAGMASTWVGYFDEQKVKDILAIDEELIPLAIITVGYPAEIPDPSPRRRLDDVIIKIE